MQKTRVKIPRQTENEILYQSARTCCVCRTPRLPIHIHHIDENPSNNYESNLIVLCTTCHDEAHTNHYLSNNLTAARLKSFKSKWKEEIQSQSSQAMLPGSNLSQAMWTFVNHQRINPVMKSLSVDFDPYLFKFLHKKGIIDELEIPILSEQIIEKKFITIYDHFQWDNSQRLHYLYTKAIDDIIVSANPIEIGAIWSKNEITDILSPGSIIFCMKGFYFKPGIISNSEEDRFVYSNSKNIEIIFIANTRHMYGNSALYNSFSGHKFIASLLLVKNLGKDGKKLVIDSTQLAMGYGFVPFKYNTPRPLKYGWHTFGTRRGIPLEYEETEIVNLFNI